MTTESAVESPPRHALLLRIPVRLVLVTVLAALGLWGLRSEGRRESRELVRGWQTALQKNGTAMDATVYLYPWRQTPEREPMYDHLLLDLGADYGESRFIPLQNNLLVDRRKLAAAVRSTGTACGILRKPSGSRETGWKRTLTVMHVMKGDRRLVAVPDFPAPLPSLAGTSFWERAFNMFFEWGFALLMFATIWFLILGAYQALFGGSHVPVKRFLEEVFPRR